MLPWHLGSTHTAELSRCTVAVKLSVTRELGSPCQILHAKPSIYILENTILHIIYRRPDILLSRCKGAQMKPSKALRSGKAFDCSGNCLTPNRCQKPRIFLFSAIHLSRN